LLGTNYFEECPDHPLGESRGTRSAGACNFFCTDCPGHALCTPVSPAMQIRKSSGHAVVRVEDVERLLNVTDVQPCLLNDHHALFLNKRPMAGQGRTGEVRCEQCERALLDATYRFCSIGSKVRSPSCLCCFSSSACPG
ncbi:hypothetical protein BAE44_0006573, partial [Dichanthelium oligosanthes]